MSYIPSTYLSLIIRNLLFIGKRTALFIWLQDVASSLLPMDDDLFAFSLWFHAERFKNKFLFFIISFIMLLTVFRVGIFQGAANQIFPEKPNRSGGITSQACKGGQSQALYLVFLLLILNFLV